MAIYLAQRMSASHDSEVERDIRDLGAMGGN